MGSTMILLTLCAVICLCNAQLRKEAYMTVPQLITSAGYPAEKHRVTTADGYVLQIFRIPAGRRSARRSGQPAAKGKKAVLLISGLLGSSGDFLIMGPEKSLGYMLADAGYDVWLGNLRGTVYSTHKNLTKENPAFWEYGFHEHGRYDAPAIIDKVLSVTGLKKLLYVGYSMGTTTFFTMMSQRPEYNEKVVAFVALAPAVYMDNIRPLVNIAMDLDLITIARRRMAALTFTQDTLGFIAGSFCTATQPQDDICMRLMYAVVGEDYEQHPWDMTTTIVTRAQPASFRQLEHFAKIALTGVFTEFGDGIKGKVRPYKLSNVRVPVTLLYGENDQLTAKSQILRLAAELNSTGVLESIRPGCSWPKFNHLDFVFAKDVGEFLNRPLVEHIGELFNKYYKKCFLVSLCILYR